MIAAGGGRVCILGERCGIGMGCNVKVEWSLLSFEVNCLGLDRAEFSRT